MITFFGKKFFDFFFLKNFWGKIFLGEGSEGGDQVSLRVNHGSRLVL